jgi:arginyl-tRNA synthetase
VITADVRRAIWDAAHDAAADGELPGTLRCPDPSSLRPVPAALGGGPGRYASTLPCLLAAAQQSDAAQQAGTAPQQADAAPQRIAGILAGRLRELRWIGDTSVTGPGYLNVTVGEDALAALPLRIIQAGSPACARSDILRGMTLPAAPPASLATATSWPDARARLAAEVRAALGCAAGAVIVQDFPAERLPAKHEGMPPSTRPRSASPARTR